jgi:putative salt-induced outer membrane protein YdiY
MLRMTCCAVLASLLLTACAYADEIVFTNGDRITGRIVQAADGKLVIESDVAGKITVPMSKVATFTTTDPVAVHLEDGSVINQPLQAAPQGQIAPVGGVAAGLPVPLASIRAINPPPTAQPWRGSVAAGLLVATGNAESISANVTVDANRRGEDDRITLRGEYFFARQQDTATNDWTTSVDNWRVNGKYDYFFSPRWYMFFQGRVERDRIADLDLRVSPSIGVGYQWQEGPVWNFHTEAGLAWVYEDYRGADSSDYLAARLAYRYDRVLREGVTLFNNLEFLPSLEDLSTFIVDTDIGLRINITASMFTEGKVQWRHNSDPAPGAERNDLRYIASVGIEF